LSTLADDPVHRDGQPSPGRRVLFRTIALCASLLSIYLLWSGERARVDDDLQLFAEPLARPGETLALRALLLNDVDAVEGPSLGRADVQVRLLDQKGRELARSLLVPTIMDSMEGVLRVPELARGTLRLEATLARGREGGPKVSRAVEVTPDATPTPAVSRLAGPLQHFVLGRIEATTAQPAPSRFLPRIVAGSCVPEQPCEMLVWVGEPGASIAINPSASVSLEGKPDPAIETTGLVSLRLRAHGAEAEVVLTASRAGELVATRSVRLPIALGEARLDVASPILPPSAVLPLTLTAPPGREHLIVDAFVEGRWSRSVTEAKVDGQKTTSLAPFPSAVTGLVRLQARSDRYSGESSGTRLIYLAQAGQGPERTLTDIERQVREARVSDGATDGFASGLPEFVRADPGRWAAFLLAPLEQLRMPIPLAASGRPGQLARIERLRTFLRFGVGGLLVLSALLVGSSLLRQGMQASEQAAAIMDEAEVDGRTSRADLKADRLRVVGWVVLVCVAFLAAALLIVAKPLWF